MCIVAAFGSLFVIWQLKNLGTWCVCDTYCIASDKPYKKCPSENFQTGMV